MAQGLIQDIGYITVITGSMWVAFFNAYEQGTEIGQWLNAGGK